MAQDIQFEHLLVEDGLSNGSVYSIFQDSQGFMWFGTADGLNRYDGYDFKVYKKDISDSTSISANWIESIIEDHTGKRWIGIAGGGVSVFDPLTERFTRLMHEPGNPHSLSANSVSVVFEDRAGTIWVGTYGGLNRYDRETGRFSRFMADAGDPNSISSNYITSILQDRQGSLWIGTELGGLNRYDPGENTFIHYIHDPADPASLSGNSVRAVLEDEDGNIWAAVAYAGLSRLDESRRRFTHFQHDPQDPNSLSHDDGRALHLDASGRLWFGTSKNGINIFDASTQSFEQYTSDPEDAESLSAAEILSIYEDRSGAVWVGTSRGINKFDGSARFFDGFANARMPDGSEHAGNMIWSILRDRSQALWIGTDDGLYRRTTGPDGRVQSVHFEHDPRASKSLSHNGVYALHQGRDGTLWIGTGNGLNALSPDWNTIDAGHDLAFDHWLTHEENPSGIRNNQVFSIVDDPDAPGTLWLATASGLIRFTPGEQSQRQMVFYQKDVDNPHGLQTSEIRTLLFDHKGILWVGTRNKGLYAFDRRTERFTWYKNDPSDPASLGHNTIRSLYEDHAGALWIGTNLGLNRFSPARNRFEVFTERDGLPNDVIYGILPDAQDRLWLSTNDGLSLFDPVQARFRNFTTADGIRQAEFNRGAYFRDDAGEMFFGGVDGVTVFHPDDVRQNTFVPPVVISSLQRYSVEAGRGHFVDEPGIAAKSTLVLSYHDIVLNFEFAALNFRNSRKNQYAYKLDGYHDAWIEPGAERRATFTNLGPGTYTLRIKGSNNDGVWNETGTSLRLTVAPPPWKTWWAYSLYALAIGAILLALRRYEVSRVNLKNRLAYQSAEAENLRQLDQMKSQFFANISHEFRAPLTLILGPTRQMLAGQHGEADRQSLRLIQRNASRLLQLINQMLDLAKLDARKMSLQVRQSDFVPFIRHLVMSYTSLAEMRGIHLELKWRRESLPLYFEADKLAQVFNNLLSNAFKFTPQGGLVSVEVRAPGPVARQDRVEYREYVEIVVRDTGQGIPANQLPRIFDRYYQVEGAAPRNHGGTGIGLALARELVNLHRGTITVQSVPGGGSTFTIRLRRGKTHFKPEEICAPESNLDAAFHEQRLGSGDGARLPMPAVPKGLKLDSDAHPLILIIEDNSDVRNFIHQHLASDYRVATAVDGAAGVEMARALVPHLVVCDLMMPGMDGYDVCRMLKKDEKTSHIPVILLTARAELEGRLEGLETGADDYLTKPFVVDELRLRIKNLIHNRRRMLERADAEAVFKPGNIAVNSVDRTFLERVATTVETNMDREDFALKDLCEAVAMSERQLRRKMKALTNQSPNQYIRAFRLQRAKQLIEQNAGTISEICYRVGFSNPSYFTKSFRDYFGHCPSSIDSKAERT